MFMSIRWSEAHIICGFSHSLSESRRFNGLSAYFGVWHENVMDFFYSGGNILLIMVNPIHSGRQKRMKNIVSTSCKNFLKEVRRKTILYLWYTQGSSLIKNNVLTFQIIMIQVEAFYSLVNTEFGTSGRIVAKGLEIVVMSVEVRK